MRTIVAVAAAILAASACGNSTVEVHGVKYARSSCKDDLEKLRIVQRDLVQSLKALKDTNVQPDMALASVALKRDDPNYSPYSKVSECGDAARKAYDDFEFASVNAITLHNGPPFTEENESNKNKLDDFWLGKVQSSRLLLAREMEVLEGL